MGIATLHPDIPVTLARMYARYQSSNQPLFRLSCGEKGGLSHVWREEIRHAAPPVPVRSARHAGKPRAPHFLRITCGPAYLDYYICVGYRTPSGYYVGKRPGDNAMPKSLVLPGTALFP